MTTNNTGTQVNKEYWMNIKGHPTYLVSSEARVYCARTKTILEPVNGMVTLRAKRTEREFCIGSLLVAALKAEGKL